MAAVSVKRSIAFSPSSLLELSNIQEWGQEFSTQNPLGQPCRQDVRCMWRTNFGRHDYKFPATWLGARWLSADLTLNPCTAQANAVHTDYTVAAGLIGWEVGQYSYVVLYRWWPVHLVVRLKVIHLRFDVLTISVNLRPKISQNLLILANIGPS